MYNQRNSPIAVPNPHHQGEEREQPPADLSINKRLHLDTDDSFEKGYNEFKNEQDEIMCLIVRRYTEFLNETPTATEVATSMVVSLRDFKQQATFYL